MAQYIKSVNGYHKVVGKSKIVDKSAHLTACGISIIENVPTVDFGHNPQPYCQLCQNPEKAKQVQNSLK